LKLRNRKEREKERGIKKEILKTKIEICRKKNKKKIRKIDITMYKREKEVKATKGIEGI
jgi:hypothetical protein